MLRSRSLDLSFIRRGRKRSAIRTISQAILRNTHVMAVSSVDIAPSKRSRGLSDIDPKFVSNSGLSGLSEVGTSRGGSVRIQHRPSKNPLIVAAAAAAAAVGGSTSTSRFPKLDECAHFHYDVVDLGPLAIQLYEDGSSRSVSDEYASIERSPLVALQITSYGKSWILRRSYEHFRLLDEQLHRCIYDRKFSQLPLLPDEKCVTSAERPEVALKPILSEYVSRLSAIAGNLINCAPVLNWLEVDNRGRRLFPPPPSDDADAEINTPAVAAAYAIRRYAAVASDEISFEVGDMISVIDMPPPEESIWWRGKRGFDVGFFPCECVRIIGDKVPAHLPLPGTPPPLAAHHNSTAHQQQQHKSSLLSTSLAASATSSDNLPTKPVLRKHGKLISFFRSFILSRPSRRKLKQSGILKERVFGCDLGEHLLNSGRDMPMVLKCCTEFIEEYGIVDGIYRLSGVTSNIQKLRNAFDEDRVPALVEDEAIRQDIHAVSSLLKMYFRELPNPLCTYQLYDQFVNAVQGPEDLRVLRMREVVQQLPPPHYRTLEYLTRHLARVAQHSANTGMTAKNVAIVWAPNLLRCKELEFGGVAALQGVGVQAVVTECLVRYVELIFSDKMPAVNPLSGSQAVGAQKRTRPKSLAISTPTKLLSLEEARNRALQLATQNDSHYIEVGGGPSSLPPKYHTVIDLPSDRKRGNSLKHKKSPIGWKSLFVKGRSPNKAQRKGSSASTGSTISMPIPSTLTGHQSQRAVTYIRPKLRPVKSAESLVASNRNSAATESISSPEAVNQEKYSPSPVEMTPLKEKMTDHHSTNSGITITVAAAAVDAAASTADDDDDASSSAHDSQTSRCHNRSVSHDSYFRLLLNTRSSNSASNVENPLDEEDCEADRPSLLSQAIYAEISKPPTRNLSSAQLKDQMMSDPGSEFGKNLVLASVEDTNSNSSKVSLNNLSHLDDSELNIMSSREMLAVSKRGGTDNSTTNPRQASSDDSIVDNSVRGLVYNGEILKSPMDAEQIDEVGNWTASNPAYELFCVQAEIHHRQNYSPSPDNTEDLIPDISSEIGNDEDGDSLVYVANDDCSLLETNASDLESYTLHCTALNDTYENVMVGESKVVEPARHVSSAAEPLDACYENCGESNEYATVVGVVRAVATYENVIDPANILEEEYEPIETPISAPVAAAAAAAAGPAVAYENLDAAVDVGACYENICDEQTKETYPTDICYENIDCGESVNVYEDVVPPPSCHPTNPALLLTTLPSLQSLPTIAEPEEEVYNQVKFLRRSIQEVNQLLHANNTSSDEHPHPDADHHIAKETDQSLAGDAEFQMPQAVTDSQKSQEEDGERSRGETKSEPNITVFEVAQVEHNCDTTTPKYDSLVNDPVDQCNVDIHQSPLVDKVFELKTSHSKDSTNYEHAKLCDASESSTETRQPVLAASNAALMATTHKSSVVGVQVCRRSNRGGEDSLSASLPSLTGRIRNSSPRRTSTYSAFYDLSPDTESESSKRRIESEIGRDLLRDRRTRNEMKNARHSESSLTSPASIKNGAVGESLRHSNSESSSLRASKPIVLAQKSKVSARKSSDAAKLDALKTSQQRPTTLETSFDCATVTTTTTVTSPQRRATVSSGSSICSPKSSSSSSSSSSESKKPPMVMGRFGSERQPTVKELLNKFQTDKQQVGGGAVVDKSAKVAPVSPIHLTTSVANVEESRKKEGKENIEVNLLLATMDMKEDIGLLQQQTQQHQLKESDDKSADQTGTSPPKSSVANIDISDPRTRLRIERYKEERRSFLREKYKSESFRADCKDDAVIVRLKQKAGSPTRPEETTWKTVDPPPPPSLQLPEAGLIEDDVNVKERAAQWLHAVPKSASAPAASVSRTVKNSIKEGSPSDKVATPPKRIRDMAAMFEKESP